MRRFALFVVACAVALGAAAQSRERTLVIAPSQPIAGETRTALVIGNAAYANGPLRNPMNDARAMGKALGGAGFEVILVENATQAGMQRAIRTFGDKLAKGGVGLFYYAGHGIQAKGRNYLIPVNAEIAREDEIEFDSVDVNLVLAKMDSAKNGLNIVILDACRNNPFQRAWRSAASGLAQMDAPTGTFIGFATAPGSIAADGAGENGIYTKYLLAEMTPPGVPIEQVFKQVRIGVMAETKGRQIPWESSSLRGEFTFRPGTAPGVAEAIAAAVRREREAQQAELQKLQAVLDRQQKQLEAQGLQQTSKPVVVASVAPTPVAAATDSRLPQPGDTWTYRLTEPKRLDGPQQRSYIAKVSAASRDAILEQYAIEFENSGEWVHSGGGYLAGLGRSLFAPYLLALGQHPAGAIQVQIVDPACTGPYICEASARVLTSESIQVPAGTFETIKVQVDQNWQPMAQSGHHSAQLRGGRTLTVWYAPAAKRAVKYSSRPTFGTYPPIDTHFDLELVSYQVQ